MTPEQKTAIEALRRCSFVPASYDKRFARQMAERLENCPDKPLTENQATLLAKTLHRYRRQHHACPCEAFRAEADKPPSPYEGLTKAGSGSCPCGGAGTLFRRRGEGGPPRCGVCMGLVSGRPVEFTPAVFGPIAPKPYPWLGEEKTDDGTMRRFCLGCGDCMECAPEKHGKAVRYPGFTQWYREHIPCREIWHEAQNAPD